MTEHRWTDLTTESELRALLGEPSARAGDKDRDRLHQLDREWLAASPFCLVATSRADGTCDVSPKGDSPGFAKAFLRSRLWDPQSWGGDALPSRAMLARSLDRPDESLDELERYYGADYANGLYPQS